MYYIDYSLNTNYMIRNLLKAANALTFSTMFLLLLAGCNKNTIIFEDGTTPNGSSGNEDPGNSTLVTFNASVEGRNLLRSMSPMNKGIQSRVYVFDSSAGTKGSPEASGLYITSSPGVRFSSRAALRRATATACPAGSSMRRGTIWSPP